MMEKYGVDQKQVEELVKLGVCSTPNEARAIVSAGTAVDKIKEARARKEEIESVIDGLTPPNGIKALTEE